MYTVGVHINIIIIGDLSETDMPDRRPIRDLDMPHRRLKCPIGVRDACSETCRRPTCVQSLIGISTHLNILIFIHFQLFYLYWNNILGHVIFRLAPTKHVEASDGFDQACRSPMDLQSVMSVTDGSRKGLRDCFIERIIIQ